MLKNKWIVAVMLLISVSFSSCGIFGKGCGCPHFGSVEQKKNPQMHRPEFNV